MCYFWGSKIVMLPYHTVLNHSYLNKKTFNCLQILPHESRIFFLLVSWKWGFMCKDNSSFWGSYCEPLEFCSRCFILLELLIFTPAILNQGICTVVLTINFAFYETSLCAALNWLRSILICHFLNMCTFLQTLDSYKYLYTDIYICLENMYFKNMI